MRHEVFYLPAVLFFLTVISRIPFTSKYLYHMDSVQFALALDEFDVTIHQPHPPGYFLYVMIGRFLNSFISDANIVFVTISIIFSGLTVVAIYFLGKELYDRITALLAAILIITSPSFWFHGEVALSYTVEAFFSCLIGLLCWKIYKGQENLLFFSAAILAVAGGIRQNTPVFLFPLLFFSVKDIPYRRKLAALAVFILLSLCWFIPMVYMTGGTYKYFSALRELWSIAGTSNSVLKNGWDAFRQYADVIFSYVTYCIGGGIVILSFSFYYVLRNRKFKSLKSVRTCCLLLWALPVLFFHILVTPGIPGHMLIILPPLALLVARAITFIGNEVNTLVNRNISISVSLTLVVINLYIFFIMKYPVSYSEIRAHDINLPTVLNTIKKSDPSTTVLLLDYNYRFFSFAHIRYYLPSYMICEPKKVSDNTVGKGKFFAWMDGKTFIIDKIVLPDKITRFATLIRSVDLLPTCCSDINVKISQPIPEYYFVSGPISLVNKVYPGTRTVE